MCIYMCVDIYIYRYICIYMYIHIAAAGRFLMALRTGVQTIGMFVITISITIITIIITCITIISIFITWITIITIIISGQACKLSRGLMKHSLGVSMLTSTYVIYVNVEI